MSINHIMGEFGYAPVQAEQKEPDTVNLETRLSSLVDEFKQGLDQINVRLANKEISKNESAQLQMILISNLKRKNQQQPDVKF